MILFIMKISKEITYKKEKNKHECPICLQKIKYKIESNCDHIFCDMCIIQHLMIKNTCPMCRQLCDYDYITKQVKPKRRKILMKKLIQPTTTVNNIPIIRNQVQQMNIYSRFIPQPLPVSIIMISIFLIELLLVIYGVIIIADTVINML